MALAWWQRSVFYEVYPRSFQDTGGDGTGDIPGITQRLDHLASLGVDAVWVAPVFPSPMTDFGYDVADYCGVDPLFGTLADMDALIDATHARGMKLILDYVPNHTSDQHPWFIDSRANGPRRDWYLWRDPAPNGGPPNNWLANFGGPAWTQHGAQYYAHSFLPTQPDLNWRNPAVRTALFDALRFWLRRGVDGVRVDVLWMMLKDPQFRDNPPNPAWTPGSRPYDRFLPLHNTDQPDMAELTAALRAVLDEFAGRVLIGEIYLPIDRLVAYYGPHGNGAHLPFNFQLLTLPSWDAATLAGIITRYEAALPPGAWPNWVLGNHDRPRIASRVGPAQARVAALLLLTLRGTPTLYMGDELGLLDTPIPQAAIRDPAELREPGTGQGRDPQRTPFPWQPGPGAGFTTGQPWLPIGTGTPASEQDADPASMLCLHRDLIALRRGHPALHGGTIHAVTAHGPVLAYRRTAPGEAFAILANTDPYPAEAPAAPGTIRLSTLPGRHGEATTATLTLRAGEAVIIQLHAPPNPGTLAP